ncbi:MAG: HD domain-containing protein [Oceanospirillaceae bacterium]|nr:HD domain-containing protein [Oceanospirillaceae bacterium]
MLAEFEGQFEKIICASQADVAHDLCHIKRVVKNATKLAIAEKGALEIVIPAAWLHDIVSLAKNDPKRALASGLSADKAIDILQKIDYPEQYFAGIHHAIAAHSYSANIVAVSLEAKIVQDADRLDALGAVGIARCFMVSGALRRPLYNSEDPFADDRALDDSRYCIDHFYQKLFQLVENMNTRSAKQIGQRRYQYMQSFLLQLRGEIES